MTTINVTKRKKEVASARRKFSFVNLDERNPCSVKYECHVCEFVFLGLYCDQGSTKTGIFSQISIRRPISDKYLFLLLFTSIVRTCTHTLCLTHRTANSYQFSKTLTMPQYTYCPEEHSCNFFDKYEQLPDFKAEKRDYSPAITGSRKDATVRQTSLHYESLKCLGEFSAH